MTTTQAPTDPWLIPGTEKGDMDRKFSVLFPIDMERKEVALVLKNRPKWQAGMLNGAGGHQKIGESPFGCANREGAQELGLVLPGNGEWDQGQWQLFHYERHRSGNCLYFYTAAVPRLRQQVKTLTDEKVEVVSIPRFLRSLGSRYQGDEDSDDDLFGMETIGTEGSDYVYNLSYLIPMAYSWLKWPQHRYLEG